jgi:SRSO17 transposase
MLFIGEVPAELKRFFAAAGAQVSRPQEYWLSRVTLATAVGFGRRNAKAIWAMLDPDHSRTALNDFFTESPWPAPAVLRSATLHVLAEMKLQPGERIDVIIDGTQKAKRGTKMEGLGWVCEAGSKEWRKGHRILLCYLRVRGVMLPWAADLYLSEKFLACEQGREFRRRLPEVRFRTLNEMAAEMIAGLPTEWEGRFEVRCLMDSGFCNRTACQPASERGFKYVVAAQSTRKMVKRTSTGRRGKRVKLGDYAPGRLYHQGRDVILPPKHSGGKSRKFRVAETVGRLKGLGEVKVVFSRRESDGNVLCLVTNDLQADAREVALAYGWRWEIEVTIKGLKGRLGLGQYQCRYYEGTVHHLHLSLLAHLLLTTAELQRRGSRRTSKRAALQLPSLRDIQNRLRQDLWHDLLEQLRSKCSDRRILDRLERAPLAS